MRKMLKVSITLLVIAFLVTGCEFVNEQPAELEVKTIESMAISNHDYDSIIVKYVPSRAGNSDLEKHGNVEKQFSNSKGNYAVVKLETTRSSNAQDLLAYYNSLPNVEYAEPDYKVKAFTNDEYYQYQWNFEQLDMENTWTKSTGEDVIVAVLDTGVAYREGSESGVAPDLANTQFIQGYDFINNDNYADDDHSHGTHVAGTIAQSTNNNIGCAGIAYNAKIMPVKVLADNGSGSTSGIVDAVYWAVDHGADVINMSLGGGGSSQAMIEALEYADQHGVVVVCASGNDGEGTVSYPAAYDLTIAVGATRYDKALTGYSNYGTAQDICAPGGDVQVDQDNDGYGDGILQQTIKGYDKETDTTDYTFGYFFYQGTSMACPHIAGIVALLKAAKPDATVQEIKDALFETAEDLGSAGWDNQYGNGLVNPSAAIDYILGDDPDPDEGDASDSVSDSVSYYFGNTDNWYISTAEGQVNLNLSFSSSSCDIDLYVYDEAGNLVTSNTGSSTNKTLSFNSNGGEYKITVKMNSCSWWYSWSNISYNLSADWTYTDNDQIYTK